MLKYQKCNLFLIFMIITLLDVGESFKVPKDKILRGEVKPLKLSENAVGQMFLDIFEKNSDLTAQIDVETYEEVSYGEMKENSIRAAIWLKKHNVGRGDVVAVVTDNRLDNYVPILSALFEGVIFNPWPAEISLKTAQHYLNVTRPKVIYFLPSAMNTIIRACVLEKQTPMLVTLDEYPGMYSLKRVLHEATEEEIENYKPVVIKDLNDIGIILFTSGSTGLSKGVAHSYLSILNNFIQEFPLTYPNQNGRATLLWYSIPTWVTWNTYFYTFLYEGGIRILHKEFDPEETAQVINEYHVNFMHINPTEMATMVRSGVLKKTEENLHSVEDFFTTGSVVNPDVFETFKSRVNPKTVVRGCYDLTETAHPVTCNQGHKKRVNVTADPVGFPEPNVQIKVIDEKTGEALGPYKTGEFFIKMPNMFLKYYNNPEGTAKAIDTESWFHTGDRGYYDGNGEFFFVDRIKDLIKYQNHQITPSEIENVLRKNPGVLDVAVVGIPDAIDGELPMAFVIKKPGSDVTEDDLVKLSTTLGKYKTLWGGIKFLDDFPRTPTKKIAKTELKALAKTYEKKYDLGTNKKVQT